MEVKHWNRQFGCETIHLTQKLTSMNLLQMPMVITWTWLFLSSNVVEVLKGQKHHISAHTFSSSHSTSSAYQRFTKQWDQLWLSASIQPPYLKLWNQTCRAWFLAFIKSQSFHFTPSKQCYSHSEWNWVLNVHAIALRKIWLRDWAWF